MEKENGVGEEEERWKDKIWKEELMLEYMMERLGEDEGLEIEKKLGIGVRKGRSEDKVIGIIEISKKVKKGLVNRVFKSEIEGRKRIKLREEKINEEKIGIMEIKVDWEKIEDKGKEEEWGKGGRRKEMMKGESLWDDESIENEIGKKDMEKEIVDIVDEGMVKVLEIEVDFREKKMFDKELGIIEIGRKEGIKGGKGVKIRIELGVIIRSLIRMMKLEDKRNKSLGEEEEKEYEENEILVRESIVGIGWKRIVKSLR